MDTGSLSEIQGDPKQKHIGIRHSRLICRGNQVIPGNHLFQEITDSQIFERVLMWFWNLTLSTPNFWLEQWLRQWPFTQEGRFW